MEKICSICQAEFETPIPNKIYCSSNCYIKWGKERAKRHYLLNKATIIKKNSERYQANKYPCPTCGKPISHYAKYCARHAGTGRSGTENHGWKGGRCKSGGYIRLLRPQHIKANSQGYVAEHIVVWEETHNKPLPAGWFIHHLNGIKDDNRPVNLAALPSMKHALVLASKAKRIQELEARLKNQGILC